VKETQHFQHLSNAVSNLKFKTRTVNFFVFFFIIESFFFIYIPVLLKFIWLKNLDLVNVLIYFL